MTLYRSQAMAGQIGTFVVALGVGAAIASAATGTAWATEDGSVGGTGVTSAESSKTSKTDDDATPGPRATGAGGDDKPDADSAPAATDDAGATDDAATESAKLRTVSSGRNSRPDSEPTQAEIPAHTDAAKAKTTVVRAVPEPLDVTAAETPTDTPPESPAAVPPLWSLLGAARRDDSDVKGAAAQPDLTSTHAPEPSAGVPTPIADSDASHWESLYTGEPSWFHNVVTVGLNVLKVILKPFGGLLRFTSLQLPILTDGVPPFFVRPGLDVERSEFEGMKVWTLTPRRDITEKVVVALHGGSYEGQVNVFQWSTYAVMARDTGATVVVPLYELAPTGTAATEVPRTANFVTAMIDAHGAENVSVIGDSAGGGLALAALQELTRRNARQASRLVLLAPWLDASMSDPRSNDIKDPLLDIPNLARPGSEWAGAAGTDDPMASPLFGALQGLPPTYVYSSSRDLLTVDTLRLRDRVLAEGISNVTFRLRAGLIHDWLIFPFLPEARAERPNIYLDLLGGDQVAAING